MPPRETAAVREKVRRRAFLVRERGKLQMKIMSTLAYEGVKPPWEYGLFTRKGVEWLLGLGLEPVDCYLRIITPLTEEIRRLSRELKALAGEDEEVQLLMTIPGVGYYTALLVKAEVGEIDLFPSGEKLCSYAGLIPSTRSSGGVTRHCGITKEGSRWLRWAMVEATMTRLKYDTSITRAYHRIVERRGKKAVQILAARRLLMYCWSVLRNRRPYFDPFHSQT